MKRPAGRNDAELLLVVLLWAFNVTVVKVCLRQMEPLAFNIIRFACASAMLLALAWRLEGSLRMARRDAARILLLGVVGHALYQLFFVLGLARTTASSTALIFGSTPVVVGLLSRLAGHERIGVGSGTGAVLAFYGVYLIVGGGPAGDAAGRTTRVAGDLLILGAVICWSIYTVLCKPLLERYSPLRVTAVTLSIGTVLLVPPAIPDVLAQDWAAVSPRTWLGLTYSFVFALVVCYVLWYRSVKHVGNLRTAIYANLVPVFGALFGVWLLRERLTGALGLGAACILAGIILTRWRAAAAGAAAGPPRAGTAAP